MPPDSTATRRRLTDAALTLWSDRGVDAVSVAEIVKAAGQRNVSALHYHFGSREGLLEAIMGEFVPVIRSRRLELIAEVNQSDSTIREVAEVLLSPLAQFLRGDWRERAFLRLAAQLSSDPHHQKMMDQITGTTVANDVLTMIRQRVGPFPSAVESVRSRIGGMMVTHAVADYSRRLPATHTKRSLQRVDIFVATLIDMYIGAVSAPVSEDTRGLVGADTSGAPAPASR